MDLRIVAQVALEAYAPGPVDPIGLRPDGWAAAASVAVHGWWPPSADAPADSAGRRAIERDLDLIVPVGTICGDRDRWTINGAKYLQQGAAQDFNWGPFGMAVPLVVYLKRVEG